VANFPDSDASTLSHSEQQSLQARRVYLIRHGETEWSLSGKHTSRTDLPLTAEGERRAELLAPVFRQHPFALVLTSPMKRAIRTCELAGLMARAECVADLREWDYGDYEGRTTVDIRAAHPAWNLFHDGAPKGETAEDVAARLRRVLDRVLAARGDVAIFGHGHALRVFATVWLELAPEDAERLALETGTVSVLGFERETRVVRMWNGRT
jgi:broad specificity phosphatase PhoE